MRHQVAANGPVTKPVPMCLQAEGKPLTERSLTGQPAPSAEEVQAMIDADRAKVRGTRLSDQGFQTRSCLEWATPKLHSAGRERLHGC